MSETICPSCGFLSEAELTTWDSAAAYPFVCPRCYGFFWVYRKKDAIETQYVKSEEDGVKVQIPPLGVNTQIFIINKEHALFLERGTIINRDHGHYRIRFSSMDGRLNSKSLWIPEHWIETIPQELL